MATKVETPADNAEKTVKIRLPYSGEEGDMVVWLNNRRFIIQRGVEVDVPEGVAEIIDRHIQLEEERLKKLRKR